MEDRNLKILVSIPPLPFVLIFPLHSQQEEADKHVYDSGEEECESTRRRKGSV